MGSISDWLEIIRSMMDEEIQDNLTLGHTFLIDDGF